MRQSPENRKNTVVQSYDSQWSTLNENSLNIEPLPESIWSRLSSIDSLAKDSLSTLVMDEEQSTSKQIDGIPEFEIDQTENNIQINSDTNSNSNQQQLQNQGINRTQFVSTKQLSDPILERLIAGYQIENEKLMKKVKQYENDIKQIHSQHQQQQENISRECSRLRNIIESKSGEVAFEESNNLVRKSAQLKHDLQNESSIRYLQDRIITLESEFAVKENDYKVQIDDLVRMNEMKLLQQKEKFDLNLSQLRDAVAKLEYDNVVNLKLIEELKSKIAWYVNNQVLIDDLLDAKSILENNVSLLKQELKKKGSSKLDIDFLLNSNVSTAIPAQQSGLLNKKKESRSKNLKVQNKDDSEFPVQKLHYHRHPSDVRKIRELEDIVKQLNETLKKRHPNSVAALVQAATYEDASSQSKKYQNTIKELQNELEKSQTDYTARLTSIRQDHEKLKYNYESLLHKIEAVEPSVSIPAHTTPIESPNSLEQACLRINELESEKEKIRTFYTRKIETLQRKSENQLISMKKHGTVNNTIPSQLQPNIKISSIIENTSTSSGIRKNIVDKQSYAVDNHLLKDLDEARSKIRELQNQLDIEKDINKTETENIKSHANSEISKLQEQLAKLKISATQEDFKYDNFEVQKIQSKLQDTLLLNDSLSQKIQNYEREIFSLSDSKKALEIELEQCRKLIDSNSKNFFEMEMKHQSEIMRLNEMLFMSKQKPETVVMLKFTYMEKQLAEMEARLTARENEYKSALQQSKFNSIKELKRLEKIHEEELREKNEEIEKLTEEIQELSNN